MNIVRLAAFSVCIAAAKLASAGLSGPPESYIIPISDGTHLVVMLAPTRQAADVGDQCSLPDGQRVSLRDTFPSSGLYRIGSTEPLWKAAWYGEKWLTRVSEDGRFAICVNRFGGGYHSEGIKLRWGIKFYDRGAEIKSYDVAELVDYPSLMEFTNMDWHRLWIDDSVYEAQIESGFYTLRTSTHETYRFEVATGQIVEEHRVWRHVARGSYLLLPILGLASGWLWYRRRRAVRAQAELETSGDDDDLPRTPLNRLAFRLRTLFIFTTAAAVCLAYPQVAVFLSALGAAVYCTLKLSRTRRLRCWGLKIYPASFWRPGWWVLNLACWLLVYVLSFGPVWGFVCYFRFPTDVRMALLQVVYAPVHWLFIHMSCRSWWLVELYIRAWGGW